MPKPAAPSNLAVAQLSGQRLVITWRDNSNNESGFKLRALGQVMTLPAGTTGYTTPAVPVGTYTIDVCATNVSGDSAFTQPVTVTVLTAPAPAPVPAPIPTPAPAPPPPAPVPAPAPPVPTPAPAAGDWSVVVTIGSTVLTFRQSEALDIGELRTASAAQRSQVRYLNHPLHVLFRPEADGSRMEIVFELGRLFAGDSPARASYSYSIQRGSTTVASGSVTNHLWQARWRWQSAPRAVVPARLEIAYAAGLLPGRVRNVGKTLPTANYSVMGTAGLLPYMPNTGGRPDIGLITDWCGQYLARGDNLATILAQAEASGSMPWHYRDERTGRPINLAQYPKATIYENSGGNPTIPVLVPASTEVTLDTAHMPNMLLVPYVLTEDPYYLEAMQFQALWMHISHPANEYRFVPGQTRALAWELRQQALAYVLTRPDDPLRATFRGLLDTWRQVIASWMAKPGVLAITVDKTESGQPITAPWEDDFLTATLGWCVQMGLTEFEPSYARRLESTIGRSSGLTEFPRNFCTSYRYLTAQQQSWAALYAANRGQWPAPTTPPTYQGQDDGCNYLQVLGGTLALAAKQGRAGAAEPAAWVRSEMERKAPGNRGFSWSFE